MSVEADKAAFELHLAAMRSVLDTPLRRLLYLRRGLTEDIDASGSSLASRLPQEQKALDEVIAKHEKGPPSNFLIEIEGLAGDPVAEQRFLDALAEVLAEFVDEHRAALAISSAFVKGEFHGGRDLLEARHEAAAAQG